MQVEPCVLAKFPVSCQCLTRVGKNEDKSCEFGREVCRSGLPSFNSFNFEQTSQLELESFSTGVQGFQLKIGMLMVNKMKGRVEQIPVLVPTTYNVPQFPIK